MNSFSANPTNCFVSVFDHFVGFQEKKAWLIHLNSLKCFLSANFTKRSNTLKQFVGTLPTNCFSAFDHFVGLVFKDLTISLSVLDRLSFGQLLKLSVRQKQICFYINLGIITVANNLYVIFFKLSTSNIISSN